MRFKAKKTLKSCIIRLLFLTHNSLFTSDRVMYKGYSIKIIKTERSEPYF